MPHFERPRYCRHCKQTTLQFRRHGEFPKSWRMWIYWPMIMLDAVRDPWRCRKCARHHWL